MICHLASQDGIEPMWEDSRNKRGGRWLVSLAKQQRHSELDHLWLETVSCGGAGVEGGGGGGGGHGLRDGGGRLCGHPEFSSSSFCGPSCCV